MQRAVAEDLGITVSVGLSGTKSLAKMASDRDKPDGFFADMTGAAAWRTATGPGPVRTWQGGGRALQRLAGIETCGDLVAAPAGRLSGILGRGATTIAALAAGIDPRPVTPEREAKSISSENLHPRSVDSRRA